MGMRGPKPKTIILKPAQREAVENVLAQRTVEKRVADRARILLLSHAGKGPDEIATIIGWARQSVWRLLKRFGNEGLELLNEKPRAGIRRSFSPSGSGGRRIDRMHATC